MSRDIESVTPAMAHALVRRFGSTSAAADALTDCSDVERERLLNEVDEPLQIRLRQEHHDAYVASAGAHGVVHRDIAGFAYLGCGHEGCAEQPTNSWGNPEPVNIRKWFCKLHADEAAPGDSDPWTAPIGIDPRSGGLIDLEAQAIERQQAERQERQLTAQRELERQDAAAQLAQMPPSEEPNPWPTGAGWTQ